MGLDVNLIKTCLNTLRKCETALTNGSEKVVQLAKNSRLREFGFSEMTQSAEGWSLRGEEVSEWFSIGEKKKLQKFIREHTTGTTVTKYRDKTIVQFGNNRTNKYGLLGFVKIKEDTIYNTKQGSITFKWWENIKDSLKKLGNISTTPKWTIQELDKHICEDFSEEMIKPVHDYLEGKLNKNELLECIKKYRKNISAPVIPLNEATIEHLDTTVPACFVPREILDNLKIPNSMRTESLDAIYSLAENGDKEAQVLLKEFLKALNLSPDKRTSIYRCVGKEELNKILTGKVVESNYNGLGNGDVFDVTTNHSIGFANQPYRVKFKVEANERTIDKTIHVHGDIGRDYYHWKVPEYTIKDVRSIVNTENNSLIYESDEEILSNFIYGYISKLG